MEQNRSTMEETRNCFNNGKRQEVGLLVVVQSDLHLEFNQNYEKRQNHSAVARIQ